MPDSPAIYTRPRSTASARPPPSSFYFPFQSYPGNPDPGTGIPGYLARHSRPYPPFMAEYYSSLPRSSSFTNLPRSASTQSFRAPFLSPASRPGSSLGWCPPSHSSLALPLKTRTPLPSTRLPQKLSQSEKPWLSTRDSGTRKSWWLTFVCLLLGLAGAGALCYLGATEAHKLSPNQLCLVFEDSFSSTLDDSIWTPDVRLGLSTGSINGIPSEFSMSTASPANLHLTNNQLYLTPTLTTVQDPDVDLFSGNFTLSDCTAANKTSCTAHATPLLGTVINPVQGARITTQGKKELRYGRVEVRAQLPQGDWLWPSITLHPSSPAYSPAFPASGLITLLTSRGNSPSSYVPSPSSSNGTTRKNTVTQYDGGGSNSITSSLAYAPLLSLYHQITGSFTLKRSTFTSAFHTYVLEWDETWMRFYVDSRLTSTLTIDVGSSKKSFWNQAGFPLTAKNGTQDKVVVVDDPYEDAGAGPNAPFDQPFYVSVQLSAGGTDGWFPDEVGGKPWFDDSQTAMRDFARAQDEWSKTWPDNVDQRSFRIDYVKMWEKCH